MREERDLGTAEEGRAFLEGGGAQFLGHETLYHKSRRPCQHTNVLGPVSLPHSRRREKRGCAGGDRDRGRDARHGHTHVRLTNIQI
jgi:hypothetical protein